VLYEVLDATIELQGADFGNIQLYDRETRTLGIVAQRGFRKEFLDYFARVDAGDGSACGAALKQRSRKIIEDVNLDPDFEPHRHIAASAGFRAVQSTPLVDHSRGEPVGMLSTHFPSPGRPSDRDLRLTDLCAHLAGDVIARRISEQRLRESEARLQAAVDLVGCCKRVSARARSAISALNFWLASPASAVRCATRSSKISLRRCNSASCSFCWLMSSATPKKCVAVPFSK
jgi:GAF domain-containing protein